MTAALLRRHSRRSSITWANPASSGKSNAEALPFKVCATRKMSLSSSVLASLSSAMSDCSISCKPSSDSAKNAATTCSRSKSISLLNLPRKRGAIISVEYQLAALFPACVLRHQRDSFLLEQHVRGLNILCSQARFVGLGAVEQRGSSEHLCLKVFPLCSKPQHSFQ